MKAQATGLFVLVTIGFIIARIAEHDGNWVSYVRAACEAAMVGALADWFAVTALFRHPLGVPIPHTAIVPKRKDQLGRNLADRAVAIGVLDLERQAVYARQAVSPL